MGCFQDAMSNLMPIDWMDPYGHTPFAGNAEMSVDITIVETDDGIRATSVKNPPRTGSNRLMNAIKNALGVDFSEIGPQNGLQQSADLGKQDEKKEPEKPQENEDDNSAKPNGPKQFGDKDPEEQDDSEDKKKKAPWDKS